MLKELKERVCQANLELVRHGLVVLTWGNVSAIDRESGCVVIKPSGVSYEHMKPEDMVVLSLDGKVLEGNLCPSSDTPTHLVLYRAFPEIGGVVHTHSIHAVSFAQARIDIPAYGTTHADAFFGDIPCTRALTEQEIGEAYEFHTGTVIEELFQSCDYRAVPGCLVKNHGPFTWGASPEKAVENAVTLEAVAQMALETRALCSKAERVPQHLLNKHYFRKHGKNAYYGQK